MLIPKRPIFLQRLINILWHLPRAAFYSLCYGFPAKKLTIIGITGTDGKTTTANFLYHVLTNAGISTGVISTIDAKIGDKSITVGLHTTSPNPATIQKLLRQMVSAGITHAILEVTSHALDQYRFYGCHFDIAAITNTSHEHLDYHHNMQNYLAAKTKLFLAAPIAILNKDDTSFSYISSRLHHLAISYSITQPSDYQAQKVKLVPSKLVFTVNGQKITTDSDYYYQVYNILATLAITDSLHIDPQILIKTAKSFPTIRGRREEVHNRLGIKTIIDYAHTPAGLESTLSSLRLTTTGKLIVIFGATGGRDQTKRPKMGQIVSQLSDIAIITADDTRHEKVEDISRAIIAGIPSSTDPSNHFVYHNIPNRQNAFNLAIKLARRGDTVIACGIGHQTTILHGKTEYPWSEAQAFRTAFRSKKHV